MSNEPVTEGTIERCIKEAKSRKLQGDQIGSFFLTYFNINSHTELTQREIDLVNKKFAQHRLPTVDGSSVPLHTTKSQEDHLKKGVGN